MNWNVYDAQDNFIAEVNAETEKAALDKAKALYPEAVRVEERAGHLGHGAQ